MKRIIGEIFDWITAIDEAIEITAKDEARSDHKGDEPQIHTCPADCKGAPGANWHSIETVGDLPEYSGKFIVTIEELFYSINCIHSGPRNERATVTAWYDADSMTWEIDGVDEPIDAVEGGSVDGVLTVVMAWQILPEPYEED